MGAVNFFAPGDWNFNCDLCGKLQKSSKGVKTWDGFYVCNWHKEARNPQDFVRGVKDELKLPWTSAGTGIAPTPVASTTLDVSGNITAANIGTGVFSSTFGPLAAVTTITLGAPTAAERRRITFTNGAASIIWVVTAPASSTEARTRFAAGEILNLLYSNGTWKTQ